MNDYIFEQCQEVNALLAKSEKDSDQKARDQLFQVLEYHSKHKIEYSSLVNHLIRLTGLYPYLEEKNCLWSDMFAREMFKVNSGEEDDIVLHIEQSNILKKLINGRSIAVSAPTSFGKSFIIDTFIAIKNPDCILIIVPTLALLNECRRRLNKKFSHDYKIITTANASLAKKNILILTQERALPYVNLLDSVDLLVVDEFYKISTDYDKERAPILQKLILDINSITKQRYFLAPNINSIKDSIFSSDIEFIDKLEFNTVFLNIHENYKNITGDKEEKLIQKEALLINLLSDNLDSKSLIYVGTYKELSNVSALITNKVKVSDSKLANMFSDWLIINYSSEWHIVSLLKKGFGVHSGQLHRPLAQIQMKLFEEQNGLIGLLSTSSIVEGINSSAKNVIIWRDRNGNKKLNYFLYKNIIGRAGRMFKYFVGEVYLLESPPKYDEIQLKIDLSKTSLLSLSMDGYMEEKLTHQQVKRIKCKNSIEKILGSITLENALKNNLFHTSEFELLINIKSSLESKNIWNGINYLNSDDPENWEAILFEICKLGGHIGTTYTVFIRFIINLFKNKDLSIPDQLNKLNLSIDEFFQYERKMAFSIPPLVKDIQEVYNLIFKNREPIDLSPFYTKVSYAFLPANIYLLEEYGLPRMIARKMHKSGLINLEDNSVEINNTIFTLKNIGIDCFLEKEIFDDFDKYIIKYFYDGI